MKKILFKMFLAMLPVIIYLAFFIAFEPNNYFNLHAETNGNTPIARIRAYEKNPLDSII